MMEKETILIQKIKDGKIVSKMDEIATEEKYTIELRNGDTIWGTCTPTHIDDLKVGSRYLAKDFSDEELAEFLPVEDEAITEVYAEEIFDIAKDFFENPGSLFADTGCAHSCALIYRGKVICQMEDIGRYNALDKVIGYALKHRIPFSASYVFASGRISSGYMQKVIDAGFPMVVSRAAVTKAAVMLAKQENITLLGFIRKNTGNIYCEGKVAVHG